MGKTWRALLGGMAALAMGFPTVQAQEAFPNRPIQIVVGTQPGGAIDIIGRALGQKMTEIGGQPVIIDNKPGASGTIGAGIVARAKPDGYTMYLASTSFAIASVLLRDLSYDPYRAFAPVSLVASGPMVLAVNPQVPAKTLPELLAWMKSQGGKTRFGSGGTGTSVHLAAEFLRISSGVDFIHIPYKGGAPAVTDLLAGHIDMVFDSPIAVLQHINSGRLRAIGVSGLKRLPAMANTPTFDESGLKGFNIAAWFGLLAPAATPPGTVAQIHALVSRAIQSPDLRARLGDLTAEPIGAGPDVWSPYLNAELTRWSGVIKQANVKPE